MLDKKPSLRRAACGAQRWAGVYGYCLFDNICEDAFWARDDYSMHIFNKVTLNVSAILNAIIKTKEKRDDITRLKISIPAGHRHYW